ncbi:protein of unknown function [Agromyces cerinus subsp. cerinus]|uniref:DUF4190 domain-containing protein n=2 Tax=Agromyces cerinus TaxID=33878 RepID=A0A1N6HPV7_9MICO|nr:protein of unknown function [Agromyces cerinus subsp. cerinus]
MTDAATLPAPEPEAGSMLPRTNTLSIVALIAGFMVPIAGIILGYVSLAQIKRTNEQGRGLALTGMIVGYVASAFTVLFLIVWLTMFVSILTGTGFAAR